MATGVPTPVPQHSFPVRRQTVSARGELGTADGRRPGALELRRELEQRLLAQRLADEVRVRRQAVLAEAGGDGDRRLSRDVEQGGVGREAPGAREVGHRVLPEAVALADPQRAL